MHKSLGVTWDWLPPPPILPQYTACTCIVYPICCSFLSNSGLITSRKRLSFSSVCVCVCGFFLQFGDKRKKLQFSPSMSRVTLYKLNWFYQCPVFPAGKKLNATVMKKMQQPKSRGKNPGHASEKRSLPLVLKTYPSFAWPGQRRSSLAQFLGQPLFDLGSLAWTEPSSSFFSGFSVGLSGPWKFSPLNPLSVLLLAKASPDPEVAMQVSLAICHRGERVKERPSIGREAEDLLWRHSSPPDWSRMAPTKETVVPLDSRNQDHSWVIRSIVKWGTETYRLPIQSYGSKQLNDWLQSKSWTAIQLEGDLMS